MSAKRWTALIKKFGAGQAAVIGFRDAENAAALLNTPKIRFSYLMPLRFGFITGIATSSTTGRLLVEKRNLNEENMIQFAAAPAPVSAAPRRCKRTIVERIADVICEAAGSGQVLTSDVFESHNIPAAVVERYAGPARDLARRRFIKRV